MPSAFCRRRRGFTPVLIPYLLRDEFNTPVRGALGDSVGANALTNNAGVTFAAGKVGSAASFASASSQSLSVASNSGLQTGDVDFWISAWVNLTTGGVVRDVLSRYGASNSVSEFEFQSGSDDKPTLIIYNGAATTKSVKWGSAVSTATWYHVILYHDSVNDLLGISVNGAAFITAATANVGPNAGVTPPTVIGSYSTGGGAFWNGLLDAVAFGKSPPGGIAALATTIRDALYNSGTGLAGTAISAAQVAAWGVVSAWDFEPMASPRTCEPGPGTLTLVQTDGTFSVSGGKLNVPSQATAVWGDLGFYDPVARVRTAGRALLGSINVSSIVKYIFPLNWSSTAAVPTFAGVGIPIHSLGLYANNAFTFYANGAGQIVGIYASGTEYQLALVMRSSGAYLIVKGGAFTDWTLLWVFSADTTSPLYATFAAYDQTGTLDYFRVVDLPAPWNDDYGIATQHLASSVTAGATFTHTANCIIEWTQTTLAAPGDATRIQFRRQDSSNHWYVYVGPTGDLLLAEMVVGSSTTRATASAVVSAGHRIVVVADGTTIRGYSNNVLRWTYSSASNFATMTSGARGTVTESGNASDLIAWPRTPSFPSNY